MISTPTPAPFVQPTIHARGTLIFLYNNRKLVTVSIRTRHPKDEVPSLVIYARCGTAGLIIDYVWSANIWWICVLTSDGIVGWIFDSDLVLA